MIVEAWFGVMALLVLVSAFMVLRVKEMVHATLWLALRLGSTLPSPLHQGRSAPLKATSASRLTIGLRRSSE